MIWVCLWQLNEDEGSGRARALAIPCLRCLGIVAAAGSVHAAELILEQGLAPITACAASHHAALQQEAAWALGNLACTPSR